MAKPIRSLELLYPMTQFLIIIIICLVKSRPDGSQAMLFIALNVYIFYIKQNYLKRKMVRRPWHFLASEQVFDSGGGKCGKEDSKSNNLK